MATVLMETRPDLKLRKILGQSYLHENRLAEALEIYAGILRDSPQDFDALMTLGNLYLAIGDGRTAKGFYQQALLCDPGNRVVQRQVEMASLEEDSSTIQTTYETDPLSPDALSHLRRKLTGEPDTQVAETTLARASEIFRQVKESPNPVEQVSLYLDEIDSLMPALIELNIRQARMDGRPELAESLQSLQLSLQYQSAHASNREGSNTSDMEPIVTGGKAAQWRVCLLRAEPPTRRMAAIETALRDAGCTIITDPQEGVQPDIVITGSPHTNPRLLEQLARYSALRVPIILDLDMDYENMPVSHPEYSTRGLGNPQASRAYTAALFLANRIIVPSESFAMSLASATRTVSCIPDSWNRQNPLWENLTPNRRTVTFGWVGGDTGVEDLALIKRVLMRLLREFNHTQLAIIGSHEAYQLFESVPADRRVYLPYMSVNDYPGLLNGVDILLAPARSHPFFNAMSDRTVMEAGVKRIPWVASPVPSYIKWKNGGVIAGDLEAWHTHLRQLVLDSDLRSALGREGYTKARGRESNQITKLWLDLIDEITDLHSNQAPNERAG